MENGSEHKRLVISQVSIKLFRLANINLKPQGLVDKCNVIYMLGALTHANKVLAAWITIKDKHLTSLTLDFGIHYDPQRSI